MKNKENAMKSFNKWLVANVINLNYNKKKKQYERAIDSVKREIREYFDDIQTECIHYVKSRVKSPESMMEKAKRKEYRDPFREMKDIAGVRVVCHNESDVEEVAEFLRARYKGAIIEDEKIKRKDGYRDHHITIKVSVLFAGQPQEITVEVQLRTIAQDLYDTLSHRDIYKLSIKLPEAWTKKMEKLGDKLEEADKLAEELKQEWIVENVATKTKDQLTAQGVIRICNKEFGQKVSLANAMNCLINLVKHGITKISELEKILANKTIIEEINKIYLELLDRKADINGIIIYGALLYKYGMITERIKKPLLEAIKDSIRKSKEFSLKSKK